MKFREMNSGVREWCGDPTDAELSALSIDFLLLNRLDFYAGQMTNAQKGNIEFREFVEVVGKETALSKEFAFGQPRFARLAYCDGYRGKFWDSSQIEIVTSIQALNDAERRGKTAIFFYDKGQRSMMLSWTPDAGQTIELWGERVIFQNVSPSQEITDIPKFVHHLVVESAAIPALNKLLITNPNKYGQFLREQKRDLAVSVERREIIWKNYLAAAPDEKSGGEHEVYSPLRDSFYMNDW